MTAAVTASTSSYIPVEEHGRRRAGMIEGLARGWKLSTIAARLGMPLPTLRHWLDDHARDLRPGRGRRPLDTADWPERIRAARGRGLAWQEVAAELGVHRSVLGDWRRAHPDLDLTPEPEPEPEEPAPLCQVVVWGEWVTRSGTRANQKVILAPAQVALLGRDLTQVWSVDCATCRRAWIGADETDAHRIRDEHLADRTQPPATTRKEAPRAS